MQTVPSLDVVYTEEMGYVTIDQVGSGTYLLATVQASLALLDLTTI